MSAENGTQRQLQFMCSIHGPGPQCGCRVVCVACADEIREEHDAEVRSLKRELTQLKKTSDEQIGEIRALKGTLNRLIVPETAKEVIVGGRPEEIKP